MKKYFLLSTVALFTILTACGQQDKSKRPSPPATATGSTSNGTKITIDYSQPGVKGRTIGKNLDPLPGKVWRTGANEATVFQVNKDVKVEGHPLAAGKYGIWSINDGGDNWTIIFNKGWNRWGLDYKKADDVLRVDVKGGKAPKFTERMTFNISNDGKVTLLWGNKEMNFHVE